MDYYYIIWTFQTFHQAAVAVAPPADLQIHTGHAWIGELLAELVGRRVKECFNLFFKPLIGAVERHAGCLSDCPRLAIYLLGMQTGRSDIQQV